MNDFAEIDRQRQLAGLSQAAVCRAAAVDPTTYTRLKQTGGRGQVGTVERLAAAVSDLVGKRGRPAGKLRRRRS